MRRNFFLALNVLLAILIVNVSAAPFSPLWASSVNATSLTYQGRIIRSDGTALQNPNVSFMFQITDPAGLCVVYQEQVNGVNMANSNGVFDIPIGNGAIQYVSVGAFVTDVFNNAVSHRCGVCSLGAGNIYTCSPSGASPYAPAFNDARRLRVSFYDGGGWKLVTPDNIIRSVPYAAFATSAYKLGENTAQDFVLKNDINTDGTSSQSCLGPNKFLTWDASTFKFSCGTATPGSSGLSAVTSSNSDIGVTDSTTAPVLTLNSGTGAHQVPKLDGAGRMPISTLPAFTGDVTTTAGTVNTTIAGLKGTALTITSLTAGNFLKYNGTAWVNVTPSLADISDASSVIKSSQMPASCSAGQTLTFSSPSSSWICSDIVVSAANFGSQAQGSFLAGPTSGAGAPMFRGIESSDLPTSITNSLWAENSGNVHRATGNVGIGITNPQSALDVQSANVSSPVVNINSTGTGDKILMYIKDNEQTVFQVSNGPLYQQVGVNGSPAVHDDSRSNMTIRDTSPLAAGIGGGITLGGTYKADGSTTYWAGIGTVKDNATDGNYAGSLVFHTRASGPPTERMRIASSGKVGIGTANPTEQLEVAGKVKGTELCIGTDCRNVWPSGGGGGGVSSVSSANTDINIVNSATTPTLTLNSGTGANQIVKLNVSARLPTSTMPALTGDVTTAAGSVATTLAAIKGTALTVTSLTSGNYLKYNGTAWVNVMPAVADLSDANTLIKSSQMPANCTAGKTLTFSSPSNTWLCSDIVVTAGNFGSQAQGAFLAGPTSGSGTPSFRNIASSDLPASIISGLWTESSGNIYRSTGSAGIGTTTPTEKLEVSGPNYTAIKVSSGGLGNSAINLSPVSGNSYLIHATGSGDSTGAGNLYFKDTTANEVRMIINSSGHVGIGNLNPVEGLQVGTHSTTSNTVVIARSLHQGAMRLASDAAANYIQSGLTMATGSSKDLRFSPYNTATPYMTIQGSTGNVGIGSAAPNTLLEVAKNQDATTAINLKNQSTGTAASSQILLQSDITGFAASTYGSNFTSTRQWDRPNGVSLVTNNNVATTGMALAARSASGMISFHTGGDQERVRIDSSGQLMIGNTLQTQAPGLRIQDNDDANSHFEIVDRGSTQTVIRKITSTGIPLLDLSPIASDGTSMSQIRLFRETNTTGTKNLIILKGDGTGVGDSRISVGDHSYFNISGGNVGIGTNAPSHKLHVNGTALATAWNTTSDARLKTDIRPMKDPLQKILQLRGVEFTWRKDVAQPTPHDKPQDFGVIAQEVEKVFPAAVSSPTNGYKSVEYAKLIAPVIEAIKDLYHGYLAQNASIERIERENTELKQKNKELEDRLLKLEQAIQAK